MSSRQDRLGAGQHVDRLFDLPGLNFFEKGVFVNIITIQVSSQCPPDHSCCPFTGGVDYDDGGKVLMMMEIDTLRR